MILELVLFSGLLFGGISSHYQSDSLRNGDEDINVGTRLILTHLVEAGHITRARTLAEVKGGPFPAHITSYSGFFTVDRRFNSNLFFWFFPAQKNYEHAPIILWLSGGPGESSMMGLFTEIGPLSITADGTNLFENPYSWHKNYSLIFIDNPVGSGFSFTDSPEGYSKNQTHLGKSLHIALLQFFKLFPELQKNELFIAGDSFAGKFVPALGYTIHSLNPASALKINLKGIAVGNGFTDPICMVQRSEYLYQLGLVDSKVRNEMRLLEENVVAAIRSGDFQSALDNITVSYDLVNNNTALKYLGNILEDDYPPNFRQYETFVQSPAVRARIHVGNGNYSSLLLGGSALEAYVALLPDAFVSVKPLLEELLDHYQVLYYTGQLDIYVTYGMSACMYETLNWSGTEEYRRAERHKWFVGNELAGYMKSAGKFTEVLVRNASHLVPLDKPAWALELITRFISNNLKHQQS